MEYINSDEGWAGDMLGRADAARRVLNRATRDALLVRIHVIIAPDQDIFIKMVGGWAENSVAVALPEQRTIVLNGDKLRIGAPSDLANTLVHEFAHLYLDLRCVRERPRWLEEGIAMHVAGQWESEDAAAVFIAAIIGGLIPLREMEQSFPVAVDSQRLAYRESYSVTNYLVQTTAGGSLPDFIASLSGQEGGCNLDSFWNPLQRDALEIQWKRGLRSVSNWSFLVLSSGFFWGLVALLTVIAWITLRVRRRKLHTQWDDEEKIYEALDEDDRLIWGDDEAEGDDEKPEKPENEPPPGRKPHRPGRRCFPR
ncbi:MAG: hypothetical protein WCK47_14470 [bacterium]|nr:hypothetical protein [Candidatus Sumerlaeota bacterium]